MAALERYLSSRAILTKGSRCCRLIAGCVCVFTESTRELSEEHQYMIYSIRSWLDHGQDKGKDYGPELGSVIV